jgi:hypothetical protein
VVPLSAASAKPLKRGIGVTTNTPSHTHVREKSRICMLTISDRSTDGGVCASAGSA